MQAIVFVPSIISIVLCSKLVGNINKAGFADTLHDTYLHTTRDLDSRLEAALASFGQPNSNTTNTKAKDIASYYNAAARGARNSCFTLALHVAWLDRRRARVLCCNLHRIPRRIGNTEIVRMECIWPFSATVDLCVVDRYV